MSDLKRFVQVYLMAGLSKAVPELDVFDRRMAITSLVKTADIFERAPTNSAAASPKRRSLRVSLLVDEVVKQVAILGNRSLGPRLSVIRTEDSG
jgi:hypothetical protein